MSMRNVTGIWSVRCRSCDWSTSDDFTIEVVNSQSGECPVCYSDILDFVVHGVIVSVN